MRVPVILDVKTIPWDHGKRAGMLRIYDEGKPDFTWGWIGVTGGDLTGWGSWEWDTASNSHHAVLTIGEDVSASDLFGELSDNWTVPQQGSVPTMPWDRTTHRTGVLVIVDKNNARKTYAWLIV